MSHGGVGQGSEGFGGCGSDQQDALHRGGNANRSAFSKPTKWTEPPELNMDEIIGPSPYVPSPFGKPRSTSNPLLPPRFPIQSPIPYYTGMINDPLQDGPVNVFYTPIHVQGISPMSLFPSYTGTPQVANRPLFPFPPPPDFT